MPRAKQFDEQEVLTKAMDLFWKQGYSVTSVQDLVNHLGINRASLYDTFGNKEKLFEKAFGHYKKTNIERISQFLQSQPDVKRGSKYSLKWLLMNPLMIVTERVALSLIQQHN